MFNVIPFFELSNNIISYQQWAWKKILKIYTNIYVRENCCVYTYAYKKVDHKKYIES